MNKKELKRKYKAEKRELRASYKKNKREEKSEYKHSRYALKDKLVEDYSSLAVLSGKKAPINPPRRHVLEEIGNSVSHGIGSLFSVAALVFMLAYADGVSEYVGACVYFFGLFTMFTMYTAPFLAFLTFEDHYAVTIRDYCITQSKKMQSLFMD